MTQTKRLGGALLALLLALPLISYGMTSANALFWGGGLGLIVVGATIPIYVHLQRGTSCCEISIHQLWNRLTRQD